MLLMKESVLSCEEKTTQPWLTYFQIAGKYKKSFKTNLLIIIFDYFSIWLLGYSPDRVQLSISSKRA